MKKLLFAIAGVYLYERERGRGSVFERERERQMICFSFFLKLLREGKCVENDDISTLSGRTRY